MRTTLNCAGLSVALLAILISEPLLAGPPRSPYGGVPHPTYSSQRQRQQQTNSYRCQRYSHQRPSVQSRQSYSHSPLPQAEFKAGDRVIVTGDGAQLMVASDVLGNIREGTEFALTRVQGQWLGANIEIDGKKVSGWVPAGDVAYADAQLQPHGKAAGEVSSGARYEGRCNVGTHPSTGWSSNSSRIPENLSTFRWGWWDLKDRW